MICLRTGDPLPSLTRFRSYPPYCQIPKKQSQNGQPPQSAEPQGGSGQMLPWNSSSPPQFLAMNWWAREDSNLRSPRCQHGALTGCATFPTYKAEYSTAHTWEQSPPVGQPAFLTLWAESSRKEASASLRRPHCRSGRCGSPRQPTMVCAWAACEPEDLILLPFARLLGGSATRLRRCAPRRTRPRQRRRRGVPSRPRQ